jgi:streptomycin 6-kinase
VIEIPEVIRNKARLAGQLAWLDDLPAIVSELEVRWHVRAGLAFADATEAFVCAAVRANGSDAVIKILMPDDNGITNEAATLRFAAGRGCVELYDDEPIHRAMLLERLGRPLADLGVPIDRRHAIMADAAAQVWRPAHDAGLPTGADKAKLLAESIVQLWEELDRPCSGRVIEQALRCAARRRVAHDSERAVLVHGDVHQWNVLRAGDTFKLIDPDALLAEPEYDLGIIMREDPVELMDGDPDDRAHRLAWESGLDVIAIREWGIVERVSAGLWCIGNGLHTAGRQRLDAAEYVAIGSP